MKMPLHFGLAIILSIMVSASIGLAEQIRFADWVGIEETDPATNTRTKEIGTFSGNRLSSIWLAIPVSGPDQIQLTLKSDKLIVSDYFSVKIDKIDNLTLRSGIKGCDGNCLTDQADPNGELIKNMKRGLRIRIEYDSVPDVTQKPEFSLRGFSRAYRWLLAK